MPFEDLRHDLTLAWRTLRRQPGFAAVVVGTLALGIAANATIFSLMNPYLFRQLPFGDAQDLVQVEQIHRQEGYRARLSVPQFRDWQEQSRAFEEMGAYYYGILNATGTEGPERIGTGYLTGNMFRLLQADAALGRTIAPGEDGPGGADVAVLSHRLWQNRFGGVEDVVGRTLTLDGRPHTIIGVMPPRFNFPFGGIQMWVPMRDDPAAAERDAARLLAIGRLAPGRTAAEAEAELERIQTRLATLYPTADGRYEGVAVRPLREALNFAWEILRVSFGVLLAAVGAVLLIACVNVASLTLARASSRDREVAVRSALGAGRRRLVRQFLTESLLLALTGGVLGILFTYGTARLLGPLLPEDLYRVGDVSVDGKVLLFTLLVTLATPLLFGLTPALRATRTDLSSALKEGAAGSGLGLASMRGRRALVVLEVTLAIVLICGAGLMIRSFLALQSVDLGFAADRMLVAEVTLPESAYGAPEPVRAYYERALAEVEALPGVNAAGMTNPLPLNHETFLLPFVPPGRDGGEERPSALWARASPGYFSTTGIELVAGRGFAAEDAPRGETVAIVSQRLAERYWEGGSPLGRTLTIGRQGQEQTVTIVGVAEEIRFDGLTENRRPMIYLPLTQGVSSRRFVVLRTEGDPAALAQSVREALRRVDPDVPANLRPMSAVVVENTLQWSLPSAFLGIFGLVALLLATLGIYGVVAYAVARRRRELGIRVALGATGGEIRRLVVQDGLRLTALGLVIGITAAVGLGQLMRTLLFGVEPFDPITFGGVVLLFLMVTLFATLVPALRASTVNPQEVLRDE